MRVLRFGVVELSCSKHNANWPNVFIRSSICGVWFACVPTNVLNVKRIFVCFLQIMLLMHEVGRWQIIFPIFHWCVGNEDLCEYSYMLRSEIESFVATINPAHSVWDHHERLCRTSLTFLIWKKNRNKINCNACPSLWMVRLLEWQ